MRIKEVLIAGLLVLSILVISGVEQCPTTGIGGIGGGGKTQASSYGLDFTLSEGLDKLTAGKAFNLGDTFYAEAVIENYDSEQRTGNICIRDDIDDAYGGIQGYCKPFTIPGATYIESKLESPASIKVIFPEKEYYSYKGLFADVNVKAYITVSYIQHSIISGEIKSPDPETETLTLQQIAAPIKVTAEKTISAKDENLKANVKFSLQKQGTYNITTTDFKRNAAAYSVKIGNLAVTCPPSENNQGIIEFENTKFISCSALLPREQRTEPFILTLDYGVKLTKDFGFKIKKTE